MAKKFPYLKSTSEPLGVVEQIAAAVTMHPDEDSADTTAVTTELTWFGSMLVPDTPGTTLSPDRFVWKYYNSAGDLTEVSGSTNFENLYKDTILRYTAYDHTTEILQTQVNKAEVG